MAARIIFSKANCGFYRRLFSVIANTKFRLPASAAFPTFRFPFSSSAPPAPHDCVNDICRVLSDFRQPHNDLESALAAFSPSLTSSVVEQVLKRCKGLGVAAHRFFLWAGRTPGFVHSKESYHILIDILGRCRQFPLIWDMLFELRDNGGGCEITPEIFWLLFRSYCRAKLPGDAVRAFGKMKDFDLKPDVTDFHQVLLNLSANRLMVDAMTFFEKLRPEFGANPKAYSILMKGWMDSGNPTEALKLFEEMRNCCDPDVVAYNIYMGGLCQLGDFSEAYRQLKAMKTVGCQPNASTYSVLLRAHCETNDVGSVDDILRQMRWYDLVPNVYTYNCAIKLFCTNEKVDHAYAILDEMAEKGANPDIWCYNAILEVHCKRREVNRAVRLLNRMYTDGFAMPDLHTYNMLLKMLIDIGRFDRAFEVWDGMDARGFYPSSSTYAVMIHGLSKKKGCIQDACKYFELMVEEGIPPYLNTCEMLRDCLLRSSLRENLHVLRCKMQQSTSCTIRELADVMSERRKAKHPSYQNDKIAEID